MDRVLLKKVTCAVVKCLLSLQLFIMWLGPKASLFQEWPQIIDFWAGGATETHHTHRVWGVVGVRGVKGTREELFHPGGWRCCMISLTIPVNQ